VPQDYRLCDPRLRRAAGRPGVTGSRTGYPRLILRFVQIMLSLLTMFELNVNKSEKAQSNQNYPYPQVRYFVSFIASLLFIYCNKNKLSKALCNIS
jgi:hypothetical protein